MGKKRNRDDWSSGSPSRTCHAVLTLGRQEALSSHQKCDTDDSASRIAELESKLAAIRHAITLATHMIIMDGQHYVAYRMGEAPHSAAGRAEQEALGIVLADL